MKAFAKFISALMTVMMCSFITSAKDYAITIESSPEDAQVLINGVQVLSSTPGIVRLPKRIATSAMTVKFIKEGYETKTVIVHYTKDQLKYNPVIHADMVRKPVAAAGDPNVTEDQARQRVSRENAGATDMEATIIRWYFDSDPRGTRIMYRVISNIPAEVKNTNETYLTTTPYEETRGFNIPGLTYQNARNVTIEIKATKRGFEDQVKRFNVRQALDQQEISGFFELVPKETPEATPAPTPQTTVIVVPGQE